MMESKPHNPQLLDAALRYAELGYKVFPCRPGDKRPATKHGLKDATDNIERIEKWWSENPSFNIGLASEGLVVVDVDGSENPWLQDDPEKLLSLAGAPMSVTPRGGSHRLFRKPADKAWGNTAGKLAKCVDTRASGGYIVVAPSIVNGTRYRWNQGAELTDGPEDLPEPPEWLSDRLDDLKKPARSRNGKAADVSVKGSIPTGQRNDNLFRKAASMQGAGLSVDEILAALLEINKRCDEPLPASEVRRIAESSGRYEPRTHGRGELTDAGNGDLLARNHGDVIRYCWAWQKWLYWDGRRWITDEGDVAEMVKENARRLLREAADIQNESIRKAVLAHGQASLKRSAVSAAMAMASTLPAVRIKPAEMDKNGWLLNVENGTIDLRSGELLPHDKSDYITKIAQVVYDPHAKAPLWDRFLHRIFDENERLIGFVQRLSGYVTTGEVREHILPIFHGVGSNGKSVFVNTLLSLLGDDYAAEAPADMIMSKSGERHPTELATLFGKRLVATVETEQGRRLNESLVKSLTGGDMITARRMREDFWSFKPSHKLIVATNHKPEVRGTDLAMWRRLKLVPFSVVIPASEQDPTLTEKLKAEESGILAWAVRGCAEYLRRGLGEPEEVVAATSAYRDGEDILGRFLQDCCVIAPENRAGATPLFEAYRDWSGDRRITQTRFGRALTERGFDRRKEGGRVFWYGIGLSQDG